MDLSVPWKLPGRSPLKDEIGQISYALDPANSKAASAVLTHLYPAKMKMA